MSDADYIIVGAGAAGCLLANRLSASGRDRVLLLEAGGRDWNPLIRVPMVAGLLYHAPSLNWGYMTAPSPGLDGRAIAWPRGRVLGGSTAINGMMHIRGHPSDYDQWRQLGLPGWSWDDVLPRFRRFERSASHPGSAYHGRKGELWTERAAGAHPLYRLWLEAGRTAGLPSCADFNGPDHEGVGLYDFTIRRGRRVSAATAFLAPARRRPNLRVETGAEAHRLLFEGRRCIGVETTRGTFRAAREVMMCGGAVNTPKLLMLSGMGPGEELRALGLPVVADSPDVGSNLQDHLGIYVQYASRTADTLYGLMRPDRAVRAGLAAMLFGRGPAAAVPLEAGGFARTRAHLDLPDVQITFVPGLSLSITQAGQGRHGFLTNVYQLRPRSRGRVRLASPDPRAKPRIEPNYLSDPEDLTCLREGAKLARRIHAQPALAPVQGEALSPGADVRTDSELEAWVRASANTIFHPVGTARMGADARAVLDARLRVRGVDGLRVADASAMPTIPGGNTMAPTMMVAESAADFIAGGE